MNKKIDIRRRIIISTILSTLTFMLIATPLFGFISDRIFGSADNSVLFDYIFLRIPLITFVLVVSTYWVLSFRIRILKVNIIAIYPTIVLTPFVLLFMSLIFNQEGVITGSFTSIIASIAFYLITYFILLTVNILNNSVFYELPLEQAAKAAQFIFSLASSYLLFVLIFGTDINLIARLVILFLYILYYSFSSIIFLKNIDNSNSLIKSLSLAITMTFAAFVLSTWPIDSIYLILSLAVIFYILLSISLEVRETINKYVFIEYGVLLSLIASILIFNSDWGIIGSVI
ncbi:MAG: hypothetical protein Q9M91_07985 [Candidatus Dojkabacteria bacterium]|nr:hypothetical protein [Candidatus Dojkabacteria bacterium]MDQ7021723.1 hypothetical protein [Candidatus Dojkabacteria bacterium]